MEDRQRRKKHIYAFEFSKQEKKTGGTELIFKTIIQKQVPEGNLI